jgi:hypothetical protein
VSASVLCADGLALPTRSPASRDALSPARHKEVFHSSGSLAGGVRVALFAQSPVHLTAVVTPRASALLRASRFTTTLSHRFEQGTNCPPAERCVHDTTARKPVELRKAFLLMGKGFSVGKCWIGMAPIPLIFARTPSPLRRRGRGMRGENARAPTQVLHRPNRRLPGGILAKLADLGKLRRRLPARCRRSFFQLRNSAAALRPSPPTPLSARERGNALAP